MLRLAFNAVSIATGGGLNGVLGYLRAWQEIESPLQITVYGSRPAVLDAIRAARPDVRVEPYAVNASSARHYLMQQIDLGPRIARAGADVVMTTQQRVGRCAVPQLVHHRNLKRFLDPHPYRTLLRGQVDGAIKDLAARHAMRVSACNAFISDYLRREAERFEPSSAPRNHVVYNGLSADLLAGAEAGHDAWDGRPHLVAVQAPADHKDNPTLLKTLRHLVDREPQTPWRLTIAGDWDWSRQKQLAAELGVADRIEFAGYLSHAAMEPLLRQSVCLVFTSVLEGFGNPPIEAMARSCPTVACNITAMPEVIGDAGVLVEPRRPDQFAEAILKLYHDRAWRASLVQRGLQRIQRFRWSESAARMYRLLAAAAEGRLLSIEPVTNTVT